MFKTRNGRELGSDGTYRGNREVKIVDKQNLRMQLQNSYTNQLNDTQHFLFMVIWCQTHGKLPLR